jgi:hypothetical protein
MLEKIKQFLLAEKLQADKEIEETIDFEDLAYQQGIIHICYKTLELINTLENKK